LKYKSIPQFKVILITVNLSSYSRTLSIPECNVDIAIFRINTDSIGVLLMAINNIVITISDPIVICHVLLSPFVLDKILLEPVFVLF
jgi:hypothetical protein